VRLARILVLLEEVDAADPRPTLTEAAFRGSSWTVVQVVLNKGAAAIATFLLGFLLSAEQFGVAWFATSVGQALLVLPVVAIIDILLAHPRSFSRLSGPSRELALRAGTAQAAVGLVAAAVLSQAYPSKPGLFLAMAVVSMRPLVDSIAIVPMSGMRIGLRYGVLAKVDCAVAFCASVCSVAIAWLGGGAIAIVLPPITAIAFRGLIYGTLEPRPRQHRERPQLHRVLRHRFMVAASGSYIASLVFMLEMVTLGVCVSTRSLGLFAFAFGLATQVNGAISFQAAGALQPIIARLSEDGTRQVAATFRAVRLLTAVVVPVLLVQCAVGGPIIRVAWHGKWDEACALFEALSVAQAAYVCQWPAAFVLKAQGRFRGYLRVQVINVVVAAPLFLAAIRWLPETARGLAGSIGLSVSADAAAPFAVILVSLGLACMISPFMLWMAGRPGRIGLPTVLDAIWRPWLSAVPVAVLVGAVARLIERQGWSMPVALAALLCLAAAGCAVGAAITVCVRTATRVDAWNGARSLSSAMVHAIPRLRR
jgi:O-antigen/teichoic acid export membrane protein